jgi:uncharacterized protein (DUF1697 family)
MNTLIALFRGINVGGHNKLPMRELVEILDGLGFTNIKTYIQSGNVVFESEDTNEVLLSKTIQDAIQKSHGFAPKVFLISPIDLEDAIASNPYPAAEKEPKTLHFYFLADEPKNPDFQKLEDIKRESERFALKGKVFYLHTPDGIGRSKLAAGIPKALGVSATARNLRSVRKIMALAKG